jgi:hypothetical protein
LNFTYYKTGPLTDAASIAKGGERREMDEESDGESRCYKRGCFTVKRIAPSDERDGPTLMAYDVAVDTLCNNREREYLLVRIQYVIYISSKWNRRPVQPAEYYRDKNDLVVELYIHI